MAKEKKPLWKGKVQCPGCKGTVDITVKRVCITPATKAEYEEDVTVHFTPDMLEQAKNQYI